MKINPSDYKILIVDDVETNVLLLKVLLTNEGYNIITASSGRMAIKLIEEELPDLILLDVLMPEMTGFEAARILKGISKFRNIPIIFLTALDNPSDTVKGFQAGGNDYITKPFNKEELIIRVEHQLSLLLAKRIITQRTRKLRETIIARDKMYSVIAHDLRSPMASIKMIMNLLAATIKEPVVSKDLFDMINMANRTTEDIYALLDNLLKWTKSRIGRLEAIPQNFDLVSTTEGIVQIYKTVASLKNIKIEFTHLDEAEVFMDIDMIKTCIRNLLSNAIKFSFNESKIKISVTEEDSKYIISVQDFGSGMKSEDAQKLLNAATHFSTYGTAQEEGSGLGLLLVEDFINKNGGKLWFESEENVGSTFYLSLPKPTKNEEKLTVN